MRYPHLDVRPLRGNLDTRLAKLDRGDYAAIILAAAGLKRLGSAKRASAHCSTPEESLPRRGQGALGIEIRADRADLAACARAAASSADGRGGRSGTHGFALARR